jgi:selenide,water dikinase
VSPEDLNIIIGDLQFPTNDKTLVGFEGSDDAGVYKLSDELAIVQTVDFITPVVDDPYTYGCIAAANSLSDIFAMGAKVITGMNVVAYDSCNVSKVMLSEILQGGIDKMKEAGGVILGGHTIEDLEMKYGISVTGTVHPDKILRNNSVRSGDKLILTKPIGSGVISTAWKGDMAQKIHIDKAAIYMASLNKVASELAIKAGVNAMTDVTGFGLLGHLSEMISNKHGADIDVSKIPFMDGAKEYADQFLFPGGSKRNYKYFLDRIEENKLEYADLMLLFDAQTSGGLLISVPEEKAEKLLNDIRSSGIEEAVIIGAFNDNKGKIALG